MEKILTDICNSVITEEDCRNEIIQGALNVSSEEDLNELWKTMIVDEKDDNIEGISTFDKCEKKEEEIIQEALDVSSEESLSDLWKTLLSDDSPEKKNKDEKDPSENQQGNFSLQFEDISNDEEYIPHKSTEVISDDDDDKESIMVCI